MSFKHVKILSICIIGFLSQVLSDVPSPRIHPPNIPYFMESMEFQTMQMNIFPQRVSGMVMDVYSDLQWNPAYILKHTGKSVYFDFNPQIRESIYTIPLVTLYQNYDEYSSGLMVLPSWYSTSSVNTLQTTPIYNFSALFTVNSRLSIGLINRSLFDYGPFRSSSNQYGGWSGDDLYAYGGSPDNYEPKRMEVDENQQMVFGNKSEVILGYKLADKIDLGFRIGHYIFNREGNLYDSQWAIYPHSSFADLNDEALDINGDHLELGIGLLYKLGSKTQFGVYAGVNNGNGTEEIASLDTADSWSERDTDPTYYSISEYYLDSKDSYTSTGKKPNITFTFERKLSNDFVLRSFLYNSKSNVDITGAVSSADTTYGDRTYDVRDRYNDQYYFQRRESHGSRESGLDGSGEETKNQWKWFISLIYAPEGSWSAFGGIQIQRYEINQAFEENSDYFRHKWYNYTGFETKNIRLYNKDVKYYSVERNFEELSLLLPLGLKARVIPGFNIILGTNISLSFQDQNAKGEVLYAERITRRWENGTLIVNDEEYDRYEEYNSNPEKVFNHTVGYSFGITYDHPSGATLFIRSGGDIFNTANWGLGFEMKF